MSLSTFIILAVLAVVIGVVIRGMIWDKKTGKSRSGCLGCFGCSLGGYGIYQDVRREHQQEKRKRNWT